jgi:type VI secretion system protein ImpL
MRVITKVILFILFALLFSGLAWWGSFSAGLWSWDNSVTTLISAASSLAIGCLLGWLVLFIITKLAKPSTQDAEAKKEKDRLEQMLRLIQSDFDQLCQQTGKLKARNKYALLPWYFLLNEQIEQDEVLLNQMGFQIAQQDKMALPVTFWVSDFAIVIGLHREACSPNEFEECLALVLKLLARFRPRQGANGVLFTLPVSKLLTQNNEEIGQFARDQREILVQLNKSLGLNLPIYNLFTDMVELSDFCQFFSVIEEQKLEQPFGAMMPIEGQPGYRPEWFNYSFDHLQDLISSQVYQFLRLQLNTEYRKSILVSPYQFGLLKGELDYYFNQLFLEDHFSTALNFRGYFFVNARREGAPVDRLAMMLATRLGNQTMTASENVISHGSMFVKKLFSQDIVREAPIVGVNRKRENLYTLMRFSISGSLLAMFAGFIWLIVANFQYYQALDSEALSQLDSFKGTFSESKFSEDELHSAIFSLSELRDITQLYEQPKPWYVVNWLPDPSIKQAADNAYQTELQNILMISLRDYLRKDLYIYNKLGNKVETLVLFNLHQLLSDPDRATIEPLVKYYLDSLTEEGETDTNTLVRFKVLIEDLLSTGAVPPEGDLELTQVVRDSLASESVSDLVYQHILDQPPFNQRVDLRPKLGNSFDEVFKFKGGFSGYLAPYIFTREGFEALMLDTDFLLVEKALKAYEDMAGSTVTKAELNRITRQLKRRYIEDYIAYWKRFIENVEAVETHSWTSLSDQLVAMVDPVSSPVRNVYELVHFNTQLETVFEQDNAKKELASDVLADAVDLDAMTESAPEALLDEGKSLFNQKQQEKAKVAFSISQPFKYYHQLMEEDKSGLSALDKLIGQMSDTSDWVKRALYSDDRGQFFFKQLSDNTLKSPLTQLQNMSDYDYDNLLQQLSLYVAEGANQLAVEDVSDYINERWKSTVVRNYSRNIKAHYPFNTKKTSDVNLNDFKAFFGNGGVLDQFSQNYTRGFTKGDGTQPTHNSFLPGISFALDASYWRAMELSKVYRKALLSTDTFGIDFTIKTAAMSSGLTEFSIRNDSALFVYRHGPAFWTSQTWPLPETQSRELEIWLKNNESTLERTSFNGDWSWFRLADAMDAKQTRDRNVSTLTVKDKEEFVELQLNVNGEVNPFIKGFFSRFKLPTSI